MPAVRLQLFEQGFHLGIGFLQRVIGTAADRGDLFELIQNQLAGIDHLAQQTANLFQFVGIQPVILIEQPAGKLAQFVIMGGAGIGFANQLTHAEQIGNAPHQFGVADAAKKTFRWRCLAGIQIGTERCLPDLHGVHAGRFLLGIKHHDAAILEPAITMGIDRIAQLALDHIVGIQCDQTGCRLIEQKQHVFAVGRLDRALETQPSIGLIKRLVVTGLQIVTTRKHDAVIFRQLHTALADGIDAHDFFIQPVEHQITPLVFLVRPDLQQNQLTQFRVEKLGIIQRLIGIFHRFGVNAFTRGRVVFHLDGQITLDGVDEDGIQDIQVRVSTFHNQFTRHRTPFKIVGRRQLDIPLAPVIDVLDLAAIGGH